MSESLLEELEAVEAILMEPVTLESTTPDTEEPPSPSSAHPWRLRLQLHPLTASDDEKKFVSLALELRFHKDYPDRVPIVAIREPRGLHEAAVAGLEGDLSKRCEEYLGSPVLFDLIDMCREFLTERNVPACACAVCLLSIVDEDEFVKTACYHYFHCKCLGLYVAAMEKNHQEYLKENPLVPGSNEDRNLSLTCPVCREPLPEVRRDAWLSAPTPALEEKEAPSAASAITPELRELQRKMGRLFLKQKAKGAIIDVEAEEKRFLVTTGSAEEPGEGADTEEAKKEEPPPPVPPPKKTNAAPGKGKGRGQWKKKGGGGAPPSPARSQPRTQHQPPQSSCEVESKSEEVDRGQEKASRHQRAPKGKYAQHHQHGRRRGAGGGEGSGAGPDGVGKESL